LLKPISKGDDLYPSRKNIVKQMLKLKDNAKEHQIVWLNFAGHGLQVPDKDGTEKDGLDECMLTADFLERENIIKADDKELFEAGMGHGLTTEKTKHDEVDGGIVVITDDWISDFWRDEMLKKKILLLSMFDACHSGTMMDLHWNYDTDKSKWLRAVRQGLMDRVWGTVPNEKGICVFLSGCMDTQTSKEITTTNALGEDESGGALTIGFLHNAEKDPEIGMVKLLENIRNETKQRKQHPQVSANKKICMASLKLDDLFHWRIKVQPDAWFPLILVLALGIPVFALIAVALVCISKKKKKAADVPRPPRRGDIEAQEDEVSAEAHDEEEMYEVEVHDLPSEHSDEEY